MPLDVYEKHPVALARERAKAEAAAAAAHDEAQDYCRICRGEATPDQPLFYPCKCSGSIKFVHQECLMEWLSHSQKKKCELCKTSFRFTKIYDRSMPATLPFPLFLRQLVRHSLKGISRWMRYVAVAIIWLGCLPWCIRQAWRGLFWLADGGWLNEKDVYTAAEIGANATSTWPAVQSPEIAAVNFTVPEYLERVKLVFPPMQVSLADIARVVFSQGLIGRLLQLVFSLVMPLPVHNTGSANVSNASSPFFMLERPPSVLSDVQFLANWSPSPAINNATVDIVEGQLICVLLVTAFILVFLIREWVINQQNIPNLPDADLAEIPQPAFVAQNEAGPVVNLQPPNPQDVPGIAGEGNLVASENEQRPIAIPTARRALTDDNILNVVEAGFQRPELPVRSQSLLTNHDSAPDHSVEETPGESSAGLTDDHDSIPFRRRSLSNSMLVQGGFEVAPNGEVGNLIPQDRSLAGLGSDSPSDSLLHTPDSAPLGDSGSPKVEESWEHAAETLNTKLLIAEAAEAIDESGQDILRPRTRGEDTESDGPAVPTPDSSEAGRSSTRGEDQSPVNGSIQGTLPPPEEPTILGRLSQWLWHIDDSINDPILAETEDYGRVQDDEEVVEGVLPEAPFVPNHNREAIQAGGAALEEVQAREPDFFLGVDLNDQNGAEDGEDLDGVLELLGMEGPIFGMFQNVVFSLFLIMVTLTASVWCPYIWGKIALLVMSNPFGMLVKAPLFVLSKMADIVFDMIFFMAGLGGFVLAQPVKLIKAMSMPFFPALSNVLNPALLEGLTLDLTQKSGARLERTLSGAALHLRPDLPTFSMVSYQALKSFKASFSNTFAWILASALRVQELTATESLTFPSIVAACGEFLRSAPGRISSLGTLGMAALRNLPKDLTSVSSAKGDEVDYSLVEWSTEDRILTIILGYAFFAAAGIVFLELAHVLLGLQENERVEGYIADCLRQAGGVMKVIVIIGIEMLVFPLYCGLLLDLALLPLFSNATVAGRIGFIIRAPFTGIFIHWFIGTCYMFHFALFVSICRKIMRTGVLYFIRDPDDPNFHPVRDVLERPIPAQLGKIAFSALVYGGLVIVCLGGVIWTLGGVNGIFPIQWATAEPKLAFPVDIIFYNFMLPFILRKAEPSKKISAMYKWWFQVCAKALRLTDFLFGEQREEEKYSSPKGSFWGLFGKGNANPVRDGVYVRAPASDSVRIPKERNVFLEVTEQNDRVDGLPDLEYGIHGSKDERFTRVYLPPKFRARIAAFIVLVWLFAASTGVAFTIGPLLVGRKVTQWLSQSTKPPNDLYAFTIGIHIFAILGYAAAYARSIRTNVRTKVPQWFGPQILSSIQYGLGLTYLGLYTLVILPFVLSLITELYIHVPLFTYLEMRQEKATASSVSTQPVATIFILQSWTIGLLYLRLLLRLFSHQVAEDSQVASALRAITRNGYLKPDIRLASRAFVLPTSIICLGLLGLPLAYAKGVILLTGLDDPEAQMRLYRMAYPAVLGLIVLWLMMMGLQRQLASWRAKIRDEVYLIGERLHNFHESTAQRAENGKGKEKAL
ncbi:hypothetical protein A1O1_04424 [Capronia coronata CBS 617.96]|uniref:RING-type E3 ubiquitin transferase n=1 Tax=Capronia coronata CBS 617.96 TaxID=1182541 RepID=W9YFJ2_9EURO|nr:uncharacterized protein A1O1_04424 [Capronia coronata CBS 617.96]EXJ91313.1 hypothetical protein A1O1_04424 [Capronia coronata CBS 617.96]